METLANLALGFEVALTVQNFYYCFLGALLGTLIGILPGLGPVATVAMLLPVTFTLPPQTAIIMLAGIYYGAQYGGSTTAILVNLPGETSSVVTAIDGYKLARQGQAGPALGIAAIGSFIAGCFATFVIVYMAPILATVALRFGPAEYFSLMVFGLLGAVILASGSAIKSIEMVILGLLLGLVGTDVNSGVVRYTFGIVGLMEGISFVALSMAIFGLAEVINNLGEHQQRGVFAPIISRVMPSWSDLKRCFPSVMRGTFLGSVLGVLPGGGALLASYAAYAFEKKVASHPRKFGHGDIRGVAAPESANNAGAQTSFIPMITLGIPSNPTMALMIGALMIQGIAPGPQVMKEQPQLFWGLIVSMWVGNAILLMLNLPLIRMWVFLLKVPYRLLFPVIVMFCCIGVYSVNNSLSDLYLFILFTLLGLVFIKLGCEPAPLTLGFILGPMMEEYLRRALLMSRGDASVFFTEPISLAFLCASVALLIMILIPAFRRTRDDAMQE
jgi:TctA family transporter